MRRSPIPFAEGALTHQRHEVKLLLRPSELAVLKREPDWLAEDSAAPETCVVSIYFDRPDGALTARALARPDDCLKLRTKEYAPDHGADPDVPRVVIEAKREHGGTTAKRRIWMERAALGARCGAGPILAKHLEHRETRGGLPGVLAGGRVRPVLAVSYWRRIYQRASTWRVTEDRQIGFHAVSRELALGTAKVLPERLPAPFACEEHVVLEVKFTAPEDLPAWLAALCRNRGAHYSKFAEGMRNLSLAASGRWSGDHGEEALGRVH